MNIALAGGATGIGAAVAAQLLARGDRVTVFDIAEPSPPGLHWIKTDLSDAAAIANAIDVAEGPFDALINCAGLPPREGLSAKILAVNYFGLRDLWLGLLPKLAPGASIVNVASRAGAAWRDHLDEVKALMRCDPAAVGTFVAEHQIDPVRAYTLSKEAVIALTLAKTADMVVRGLRVNAVSPAAVSTGILDDFVSAFGDRVARNIARAGRPGTAQEVAEVIVFLAGPESAWIKGQDIVIDGGMTAMAMADALDLSP
jgi:NAD(P)-dependent dehydrogenase (short-subunit alcohol dehydrogenase family)